MVPHTATHTKLSQQRVMPFSACLSPVQHHNTSGPVKQSGWGMRQYESKESMVAQGIFFMPLICSLCTHLAYGCSLGLISPSHSYD